MKKIKIKNKNIGFFLVFLSIIIYAFQSIIARIGLIAGVHPFFLAFIKLISGFLTILFLIIILKKKINFKKEDLFKWLFFGIIGGTLFALSLANSYNLSGASQGVIYMYTAPAFAVIIAHFYLKEKITFLKSISVLLVILGTTCVAVGAKGSSFSFNLLGFIFGILSGITYGIFSVIGKKMSEKHDSWTINFFYTLIGSSAMIPLLLFFDLKNFFLINFKLLLFLGLSGFLVYGVGNFLFMKSMKYLEVGEVMIFANLEPIIAVFLAILLLNETLMFMQIIGFLFILLAIFIISFTSTNKKIKK